MSPKMLSRARNRPTPLVLISLLRSPRKKLRRLLVKLPSPKVSAACCAPFKLVHSNGIPTLLAVSQVSMMRLAGAGLAVVGPLGLVLTRPPFGGEPAAGPPNKQAGAPL